MLVLDQEQSTMSIDMFFCSSAWKSLKTLQSYQDKFKFENGIWVYEYIEILLDGDLEGTRAISEEC